MKQGGKLKELYWSGIKFSPENYVETNRMEDFVRTAKLKCKSCGCNYHCQLSGEGCREQIQTDNFCEKCAPVMDENLKKIKEELNELSRARIEFKHDGHDLIMDMTPVVDSLRYNY